MPGLPITFEKGDLHKCYYCSKVVLPPVPFSMKILILSNSFTLAELVHRELPAAATRTTVMIGSVLLFLEPLLLRQLTVVVHPALELVGWYINELH
jgi:hypothetical protein